LGGQEKKVSSEKQAIINQKKKEEKHTNHFGAHSCSEACV